MSTMATHSSCNLPDLLRRMEGVTVALVSPLHQNGEIDAFSLEKLVERVIQAGASGLLVLGWCGEGPLLTERNRKTVLQEVCRINHGRVATVAGVSEQSLTRALEIASMAREYGVDAVLSTPPYSYPIPQALVFEYFKELSVGSGLPVIIYQNDEVAVRIEHETLASLSSTPGIIGVKATTSFTSVQRAYHRLNQPDRFAVMSGDEYLYGAALSIGIKHFTMGGPGNLCPAWCASMYRSALAGKWDVVSQMHKRLTSFCDAIYEGAETPYASVKYALHRLGMCSAYISSPHRPISPEHQRRVDAAIKEFAEILSS
jgi:4-hydroxy-tetrahydrodipicolinate synthase